LNPEELKRTIIKIDEDLCNGCGECIPNCHEGALQIIDGKARLVSDIMCDGLGACIGHCPLGAISIEEREAQPYDEILVMEQMVKKGRNTILAHLQHLRDHNETEYLKQAIDYIKTNNIDLSPGAKPEKGIGQPTLKQVIKEQKKANHTGCPGLASIDFSKITPEPLANEPKIQSNGRSELRHWPVQLHLLNPNASYLRNADVVLAADCVGFALGDFHQRYLKGKSLAIACPKLDSNLDVYVDKLVAMIQDANINTLTVVIMEVPCCSALQRIAQTAIAMADRKIPLKLAMISLQGEVLKEEWL